MNVRDKAKAFFTYATGGPDAVQLLVNHLADENEKDADFCASVLGFTKTQVRDTMIRLVASINSGMPPSKLVLDRIQFVFQSNPLTRNEHNLSMLASQDPNVRSVGVQIAIGRFDRSSILPDKLIVRYPNSCALVMKELYVQELLGEKGGQVMADLALESEDPKVRTCAIYGLRHAPDQAKQFFHILGSHPKADVRNAIQEELQNFRFPAKYFADLVRLFRCSDPNVQGIIDDIIGRDISDDATSEMLAALDRELGDSADAQDDRALLYVALLRPTALDHQALVRKAYRFATELGSIWRPFLAVQVVRDTKFSIQERREATDYLLGLLETEMEPARKNLQFRNTYYDSLVFETLENEAKRNTQLRERYLAIADKRLKSKAVIWYDFRLAESIERLGVNLSKYRTRFVDEYKKYRLRDVNERLLARMGADEIALLADSLNDPKETLYNRKALVGLIGSAWKRQPTVRGILELQVDSREPTLRLEAAKVLADNGAMTPKSQAIILENIENIDDVESLLHVQPDGITWFLRAYRAQVKTKVGPSYQAIRELCASLKKNGWSDEVFQAFCDDLSAGYTDYNSPYRRVIIANYLSHAPKGHVEQILKFVFAQLDRQVGSLPKQPESDIYIPGEDAPRVDASHVFSPFFSILEAYAPSSSLAKAKLVELLKSPEYEKQMLAIQGVAKVVKDVQEMKRLIEPLIGSPSLGIRRNAMAALDSVGLRIRDLSPQYRNVIVENYQVESHRSSRYRATSESLVPDSTADLIDFNEDNRWIDPIDTWPNPPLPAHISDITPTVNFDGNTLHNLIPDLTSRLLGGGYVASVSGGFAVTSGWIPIDWNIKSLKGVQVRTNWPEPFYPLSEAYFAGPLFLEKPGHYRNLQIVVSSGKYGSFSPRTKVSELPYLDSESTLSMRGKHVYLLEYRFEKMADGTMVDEDGYGGWITPKDLGLGH